MRGTLMPGGTNSGGSAAEAVAGARGAAAAYAAKFAELACEGGWGEAGLALRLAPAAWAAFVGRWLAAARASLRAEQARRAGVWHRAAHHVSDAAQCVNALRPRHGPGPTLPGAACATVVQRQSGWATRCLGLLQSWHGLYGAAESVIPKSSYYTAGGQGGMEAAVAEVWAVVERALGSAEAGLPAGAALAAGALAGAAAGRAPGVAGAIVARICALLSADGCGPACRPASPWCTALVHATAMTCPRHAGVDLHVGALQTHAACARTQAGRGGRSGGGGAARGAARAPRDRPRRPRRRAGAPRGRGARPRGGRRARRGAGDAGTLRRGAAGRRGRPGRRRRARHGPRPARAGRAAWHGRRAVH